MDEISVSTRAGRTDFRPGEAIEGSVSWNLAEPAQAVEIRLVWFTRGKGTPDVSIVESSRVEAPSRMADSSFRFTLPEGPHSFSGKLISLIWAVEAVALANRDRVVQSGRIEFVLSSDGKEIVLAQVQEKLSPAQEKFRQRKAEYLARKGQTTPFDQVQDDTFTTHR